MEKIIVREQADNYLRLKEFSETQGIDLFGVADVSSIKKEFVLSENLLNKFDRAVCIGLRLADGVLEEIKDAPTRLYFHHYRTANVLLDQIAFKIGSYIQKKGYFSLPVPASQILDWQKQTAHLSHKKIGYLAGLGWIGRNNLLVNEGFGSHFRLATILTDMPLKLDKPLSRDCGDCKLCVQVCPCGAIKDNSEDFEHIKCFEKLKEFQKQRLVDQFICGVCVNACRGNRH